MHDALKTILDPNSVKEICDVDPVLFDELLVLFSEQFPLRMKNLTEHFKRSEKKEAERMVHTLKSSAAQIGALELSKLCKEFESNIYQCSSEYAATQTLKINQSAQELLTAISEHLKTSKKAA